jgi:hypothetical protein
MELPGAARDSLISSIYVKSLRIVFYTSGITGTGRIVKGIAIGNALKRKNIDCDYTILNSSAFAYLCDLFSIKHIEIPVEDEYTLTKDNFSNTYLYKTLNQLKPDILIIDLLWFPLYHFIERLDCKKIFLCQFVYERFFSIQLEEETLKINPDHYDQILAIEPFECSVPMKQINPLLLRNKDEILSRDEAIHKLGLEKDRDICLYAFNNHPGDFDKFKKKYSHLEEFYQMVYTTNYKGGIFPIVDYFNAFDYIVCGASYNIFWEVIYFQKESSFENITSNFTSTEYRIENCQDYVFEENGADQLVDIILNLVNQ